MPARIRKLVVQVDETRIEMGRTIEPPTRKALAMAVIANPCAGRFEQDLDELIAIGEEMGALLGWKAGAAAYAQGQAPQSQPANALAIVPSTKKVGPPGASLDVPLTHINASYVRSHFDAMEVRVPGAPAAGEIVFILAMSTGARVHARVGGLKASEISKWDGQR